MKKIVYSLFALLFCSIIAMAQTTLMSDEDHRIMMNNYTSNLNSILATECPQGMTIDQFKKKIVNGELSFSSTAQASILTYAEPLKTYGAQFAGTKSLTATTDAEKIFLSSFAPDTAIDSLGNLVENTTPAGLTPVEMWDCTLSSFNTGDCGINAIVSDKADVKGLVKAATIMLTQQAGVIGVLLIVNDFKMCISTKMYFFEGVSFNYIYSYHLDNNNAQYENNILKFPSWEKYYETIDVLDELIDADCDKFDATVSNNISDDQYDYLASGVNFDEDNVLKNFEDSLGFYSLRKKISIAEDNWLQQQGDGQWNANNDPDNHFIDDETERALLSVNAEVLIGNDTLGYVYYKFLDDNGGMIQINNWDIDAIIQVSNGTIPVNNPNVVVFGPRNMSHFSRTTSDDCKRDLKEVEYETNGSNRIKRKSKVRNSDWWSHKKISALTIGYKKKNGKWKRRRTRITAGITDIDGITPGIVYNECSTQIEVSKVKERRRRRVKVKIRGDRHNTPNGAENLIIGIKNDKIYTYHKQGTLNVKKDYYDMPNY